MRARFEPNPDARRPPGVILTGTPSPAAAASARAALSNPSGTVITTSPIELTCATAPSEYESIARPPTLTNALGTPDPSRTPLPAATMIAEAVNATPL